MLTVEKKIHILSSKYPIDISLLKKIIIRYFQIRWANSWMFYGLRDVVTINMFILLNMCRWTCAPYVSNIFTTAVLPNFRMAVAVTHATMVAFSLDNGWITNIYIVVGHSAYLIFSNFFSWIIKFFHAAFQPCYFNLQFFEALCCSWTKVTHLTKIGRQCTKPCNTYNIRRHLGFKFAR